MSGLRMSDGRVFSGVGWTEAVISVARMRKRVVWMFAWRGTVDLRVGITSARKDWEGRRCFVERMWEEIWMASGEVAIVQDLYEDDIGSM